MSTGAFPRVKTRVVFRQEPKGLWSHRGAFRTTEASGQERPAAPATTSRSSQMSWACECGWLRADYDDEDDVDDQDMTQTSGQHTVLDFTSLIDSLLTKYLLFRSSTSYKFILRHRSCFAVIESGEGNPPPPHQNNWLRNETKLTFITDPESFKASTEIGRNLSLIHTQMFSPRACPEIFKWW